MTLTLKTEAEEYTPPRKLCSLTSHMPCAILNWLQLLARDSAGSLTQYNLETHMADTQGHILCWIVY